MGLCGDSHQKPQFADRDWSWGKGGQGAGEGLNLGGNGPQGSYRSGQGTSSPTPSWGLILMMLLGHEAMGLGKEGSEGRFRTHLKL